MGYSDSVPGNNGPSEIAGNARVTASAASVSKNVSR